MMKKYVTLIVSGDLDCSNMMTSRIENKTLHPPHIVLGGNLSLVDQVVPLEDAEDHHHPSHVHLEDNSLVYALINRTAGLT